MGIDIGSRSVKLLQLTADQSRVWEAARWDLATGPDADPAQRDAEVARAICQAREGRNFRGRDAVFCLGAGDLFVQNIRVAQATGEDLRKLVQAEATGRLPFSSDQAELRYLEAADVRQGDSVRREVIVLASRRTALERIVALADAAKLVVTAIDVEPTAMLRGYAKQYRRDEDLQQCLMFVNIGASSTSVVIARAMQSVFIKYVDIGGRHLDEAVAKHLRLSPADAASLRRHNGDRRSDQRDPEVARGVNESVRPVLERLACELSMCVRYYSVTFRGQPLGRIVVTGGEATVPLVQWLANRLDLPCELGDPLRSFEKPSFPGRLGQWDIAAGLALRRTK
jgi:type IV pilus assembly protein PilM